MKSVTGVRDRKHTHVSNLTISSDQLAYYREREPREPTIPRYHLPIPREVIFNPRENLYMYVINAVTN